MGKWTLLCPTDCAPMQGECHYTGGHGKPFHLHCQTGLKSVSYAEAQKALKIHKVKDAAGMPRGANPGRRLYEPYGLTAKEKASKRAVRARCTPRSRALYCRLVRCIKKVEPRERAGEIKSAVAVCRAKIK